MERMSARVDVVRARPAEGSPEEVQEFLHDPVGCMRRLQRTHGLAVAFRKGSAGGLFAFGPEHNRQLFANPDAFAIVSRFPGPRHSAQRRFGRGLFSMNGAEHQEQRRLLMPPFRKEQLSAYHPALVALTAGLLGGWRAGAELDMWAQMKEHTLRITTRLLFGVEDVDVGHAIEALFEEWLDLNHVVSFASLLPVEAPPGCYERLLDVAERLEVELQRLVERRRSAGPGGADVLAILLRAQDAGALGAVEVIGQTITLFNAAYHTTTAALTWSLFLLAQHPGVLRRLAGELDGTLGGAAPTPEGLARLPLLERVIKESLRLLPPVVYLPRITARAAALGGYELAPGTMVLLSPYVTHHLPEVFVRPERFEPDRWLAGAPAPAAYIPFGGGSRQCLGAAFATQVLKVTLALVLQRWRLRVVPGARIERHGTLSLGARHGVPMEVWEPGGEFASSPVVGNIHEMVDLSEAEVSYRWAG
jgi:cytochrome P450